MKINDLDSIISEILEKETRKLIVEQATNNDHVIDSVKNFQSLSNLMDKISNVESIGNGMVINIQNLTPEELIDCCGGTSLGDSQKNLMQGLHHDLEDTGFGSNFDIDIDIQGDENNLGLNIKISGSNDEMGENVKDTNPTADDKKDIILGGEQPEENKNTYKQTLKKMSENKKTIRLNEVEMADLLTKIIKEAVVAPSGGVLPGGVPGIDITKKARKDSGDENNAALKAIEEKIRKYLSFEGNDNPEFPRQIGKGTKVARENSPEEDDVVDDNRGRGTQDLTYDQEPSKGFRDRAKMSLTGASKMGNPSDAANAIKTDVGDKMAKSVEKRQQIKKDEPIYEKEAVPVKTKENTKKDPAVEKEMARMKQMSDYNKKTQ